MLRRSRVEDGVTGFLAPPGSPEGLARALEGAVTDVEASARLARTARSRVESRFSVDAVLDAYLALYRRR